MGRPRKLNMVRDKSGKHKGRSRGEREEIDAQVMAVRQRLLLADGVDIKHAKDQLAGFTLGRLLLRWRADHNDPSGISQEQYDAGNAWAQTVHRHAALMGYKLNIRSPAFTMVGGFETGRPPDEQDIIRIRRRFSDYYNEMMEVCRQLHTMRIRDVTYGVCVENWPMSRLYPSDYGALRYGLNALAKVRK